VKRLVIIGAGGHGRLIAGMAEKQGTYQEILLLDDGAMTTSGQYSVVGKVKDFSAYLPDSDFFVAFGDNGLRRRVSEEVRAAGGRLMTFIHPSAIIDDDVTIGEGVAIIAGAVVNKGAVIGDGVILNTLSSVDHDSVVGAYSHIAVGAHIAGEVKIGESVFIGAGVNIIEDIKVATGSTIGAGAVVVRTITEAGTYVGVPAKKLVR